MEQVKLKSKQLFYDSVRKVTVEPGQTLYEHSDRAFVLVQGGFADVIERVQLGDNSTNDTVVDKPVVESVKETEPVKEVEQLVEDKPVVADVTDVEIVKKDKPAKVVKAELKKASVEKVTKPAKKAKAVK